MSADCVDLSPPPSIMIRFSPYWTQCMRQSEPKRSRISLTTSPTGFASPRVPSQADARQPILLVVEPLLEFAVCSIVNMVLSAITCESGQLSEVPFSR